MAAAAPTSAVPIYIGDFIGDFYSHPSRRSSRWVVAIGQGDGQRVGALGPTCLFDGTTLPATPDTGAKIVARSGLRRASNKSGRGYVESRAHSLDRPSSRRCRLRPVLTPTGGVWAAQPARLRKRNRGRTGCSIVCHAVGITLSSLLSSTWMVSHGVSLQT